jgi:hypothetical protein
VDVLRDAVVCRVQLDLCRSLRLKLVVLVEERRIVSLLRRHLPSQCFRRRLGCLKLPFQKRDLIPLAPQLPILRLKLRNLCQGLLQLPNIHLVRLRWLIGNRKSLISLPTDVIQLRHCPHMTDLSLLIHPRSGLVITVRAELMNLLHLPQTVDASPVLAFQNL